MASFGAVTMLIIEFILGMIYNLYGTAPTASKSIGLFSSPVLALHVIMSILLLVAAVMLLVRAIGARHRLTIWMSALGWPGSSRPASRAWGSPRQRRRRGLPRHVPRVRGLAGVLRRDHPGRLPLDYVTWPPSSPPSRLPLPRPRDVVGGVDRPARGMA
jgi:hypothetical protein